VDIAHRGRPIPGIDTGSTERRDETLKFTQIAESARTTNSYLWIYIRAQIVRLGASDTARAAST